MSSCLLCNALVIASFSLLLCFCWALACACKAVRVREDVMLKGQAYPEDQTGRRLHLMQFKEPRVYMLKQMFPSHGAGH